MSRRARPPKVGTLQSAARRVNAAGDDAAADPAAHQRKLVADLCRLLDPQGNGAPGTGSGNGNGHATAPDGGRLSPRLAQTLERLLAGDSEKEIAARLRRSPNTVHVYVKELYRRFEVNSRGELLSRFVRVEERRGEDRR